MPYSNPALVVQSTSLLFFFLFCFFWFHRELTTSCSEQHRSIREICRELQRAVSSKFVQSTHSVVGGYYCLRFICPAIVSPDGFGILEGNNKMLSPFQAVGLTSTIILAGVEISPKARRALVLMSKVIIQLANGVPFGAKEAYMKHLNPFIEENFTSINKFFDTLAVRLLKGDRCVGDYD